MKFKKLLVLIVLLAVLAGAGVWKKAALEKTEEAAAVKPVQMQQPLEKSFSTAFVSKMELSRGAPGGTEKLTFAKDAAGEWTLPSHENKRARKSSVEELLRSLADLRGDLRADEAAVLGDFSLTDDKAFHFELFSADGTALSHILVSPLRPRGTQNFVRLSGSNKALVTDTDLLADLGIFSETDKIRPESFIDPNPPASAPAAESKAA